MIRALRRRGAGVVLATCLAALAAGAASRSRASTLEGIAGWEQDGYDQAYGFATVGAAIPAGGGWSLPLRLSGSYLRYNYQDPRGALEVSGPGASALAGFRDSGSKGYVSLLAGGEVRWERRGPKDLPLTGAAVARGGIVAQAEGDFAWTRRLHPFALVNYSGSAHYVYGRAGLRWQVTNLDWRGPLTWSLGLEGVGQGNSDTDAEQAGAMVECALVKARLSLSAHAGYKDSASSGGGRRQGGYIGLGLYRRF